MSISIRKKEVHSKIYFLVIQHLIWGNKFGYPKSVKPWYVKLFNVSS